MPYVSMHHDHTNASQRQKPFLLTEFEEFISLNLTPHPSFCPKR